MLSEIIEWFFGPLAEFECQRAARRGWIIWMRVLVALPTAGVLFIVVYGISLAQHANIPADVGGFFRIALVAMWSILLGIVMILTPAAMSGALADRARGTLLVLLTTEVSAREIALSRLAGGLSSLALILPAALGPFAILAVLAHTDALQWLLVLALPLAMALGLAGLALGVAVTTRSGRETLLVVYLLEFALVLGPTMLAGMGLLAPGHFLLGLNPFIGLGDSVWLRGSDPVWQAIGWWTAIGLLGTVFASIRLRAVVLRQFDPPTSRRVSGRAAVVPPMGDRPMMWKEVYIERQPAFHPVVRWLGGGVIAIMVGGTILFASLAFIESLQLRGPRIAAGALRDWLIGTSWPLGLVLQWAFGLRAAASVVSERERDTWEPLLLSPLTGREIIWGKLWGNFVGLRWLLAAVGANWGLGLITGTLPQETLVIFVAPAVASTLLVTAIGITTSLQAKSVTQAMTLTLMFWLVSAICVPILSAIAMAFAGCWSAILLGMFQGNNATQWNHFALLWTGSNFAVYVLLSIWLVAYTAQNFDKWAGRSTQKLWLIPPGRSSRDDFNPPRRREAYHPPPLPPEGSS